MSSGKSFSKDDVSLFLTSTLEFIKNYRKIKEQYQVYFTLTNQCDKATQDILHKLELGKLSQSEKNQMATLLIRIRKERRFYKDKVETLTDILKVFKEGGNKIDDFINKLCNITGNANKFYKNRESRKYFPRVIKEQ